MFSINSYQSGTDVQVFLPSEEVFMSKWDGKPWARPSMCLDWHFQLSSEVCVCVLCVCVGCISVYLCVYVWLKLQSSPSNRHQTKWILPVSILLQIMVNILLIWLSWIHTLPVNFCCTGHPKTYVKTINIYYILWFYGSAGSAHLGLDGLEWPQFTCVVVDSMSARTMGKTWPCISHHPEG